MLTKTFVRNTLITAALVGAVLTGRELASTLRAANLVNFVATDAVGPWFRCVGHGCVPAGTDSLAVVSPGTDVTVTVGNETNTVHTFTSLVFPEGARHMPFDQPSAFRNGDRTVRLDDPGLYVFVCKIHPFMLAATVVDDPATSGLDLGENISLVNGVTVPTSSDLATRLLRAFWLITSPGNYQDHSPRTKPRLTWTINYPAHVRSESRAVRSSTSKTRWKRATGTTCRFQGHRSRRSRASARSGSTLSTR